MSKDRPPDDWEFHLGAEQELSRQLALFETTLRSLSCEFASLDLTRDPGEVEIVHRQHVLRTAALLFRNRSLQEATRALRFQFMYSSATSRRTMRLRTTSRKF
jgi:hypothetical protein